MNINEGGIGEPDQLEIGVVKEVVSPLGIPTDRVPQRIYDKGWEEVWSVWVERPTKTKERLGFVGSFKTPILHLDPAMGFRKHFWEWDDNYGRHDTAETRDLAVTAMIERYCE